MIITPVSISRMALLRAGGRKEPAVDHLLEIVRRNRSMEQKTPRASNW